MKILRLGTKQVPLARALDVSQSIGLVGIAAGLVALSAGASTKGAMALPRKLLLAENQRVASF